MALVKLSKWKVANIAAVSPSAAEPASAPASTSMRPSMDPISPVPRSSSNRSACKSTSVRNHSSTPTRSMRMDTVAVGAPARGVPHATLALPAAPSSTKTPMRMSTVAENATAAPGTHGHVNSASPVTRTVGASSSPCVNATCATTSTSFTSDDVAVHSNATLPNTEITRPEPSLVSPARSGMPSVVVNILMVPLISRRHARSAKCHPVRSVLFALDVTIPRLVSTKPNISTCRFSITSWTPCTGVKTNSSEGHARDKCSPRQKGAS